MKNIPYFMWLLGLTSVPYMYANAQRIDNDDMLQRADTDHEALQKAFAHLYKNATNYDAYPLIFQAMGYKSEVASAIANKVVPLIRYADQQSKLLAKQILPKKESLLEENTKNIVNFLKNNINWEDIKNQLEQQRTEEEDENEKEGEEERKSPGERLENIFKNFEDTKQSYDLFNAIYPHPETETFHVNKLSSALFYDGMRNEFLVRKLREAKNLQDKIIILANALKHVELGVYLPSHEKKAIKKFFRNPRNTQVQLERYLASGPSTETPAAETRNPESLEELNQMLDNIAKNPKKLETYSKLFKRMGEYNEKEIKILTDAVKDWLHYFPSDMLHNHFKTRFEKARTHDDPLTEKLEIMAKFFKHSGFWNSIGTQLGQMKNPSEELKYKLHNKNVFDEKLRSLVEPS